MRSWITGDYPIGVAVSKERFAALPLERHATRGAWNYTLLPAAATPAISEGTTGRALQSRPPPPADARPSSTDARLTGMTAAGLARLAAPLAPLQAARAQQRYSQQRGGRARRATGERPRQAAVRRRRVAAAHPPLPAAGLLHERARRPAGSHRHLHRRPGQADPRESSKITAMTREWPRSGSPTTMPCSPSSTAICAPPGPTIIERLSHPALTGLTRRELHDLTEPLGRAAVRPSRTPQPPATRRPAPARHPRRRLPPEDQQQRARPAHHSLPEKAVHAGRPRRRPRRRQQIRRRQRHPPDARPCSSTKTPFPGLRRPATAQPPISSPLRQQTNNADKLIPYGFSECGSAARTRRAGWRRWPRSGHGARRR